ncbi:MAG: L-serine ammonia-lyase [Litorimonas sp.]
MLSVLDIFRVGIGPSSSHTVGPMRISHRYLQRLERLKLSKRMTGVKILFRGSLAFTGHGHGTPRAALLGLLGFKPETIDMAQAEAALSQVHEHKTFMLCGQIINFDPAIDIVLDYEKPAALHPNEMVMQSYGADGVLLDERVYYSTGGGFIASAEQLKTPVKDDLIAGTRIAKYPFSSASELLEHCRREFKSIADIIITNELSHHSKEDINTQLDRICDVMMQSVERGLNTPGTLPGGLDVSRRAPKLWAELQGNPNANEREVLFDWLNVYAMAVNEENAAGGQVVTAPTNGAAGIIPAIIRYYCCEDSGALDRNKIRVFLLTAGGIGLLYKQRASISGAEMGCQGEVGVACSMAAGGLAAVWGARPEQVASAAEIGMEHNLGLTCDPVGGLVQIPCIERNAIGAVKAANAARLALHSSGQMKVSLDQVIETMRQTGLDMSSKYKETSQGGLAVNVIEC